MDWTRLTVGQVSTMLLEPEYRNFFESLKQPLRDANFENRFNPIKPMYTIAYMLAVITVWHALSEGTEPDKVTFPYLEERYFLKNLFWDSSSASDFSFQKNLVGGKGSAAAVQRLSQIKTACSNKKFQPNLTVEALLARIGEEKSSYDMEKTIALLKTLLKAWVQKLPEAKLVEIQKQYSQGSESAAEQPGTVPGKPPRSPGAPDKGAPDLKWELDHSFAKNICGLIENGAAQLIFTGAPGTGKTYTAALLARYLGDLQTLSGKPASYTLVQFHPSYDYTDFVEGLRPVQIGEKMQFVKLDGSFKAFCRWVADHGQPSGRYFFLIDEINRAELSKVFGELMYSLETDKRGSSHRIHTQYENLKTYDPVQEKYLSREEDVFCEGFFIPENVYIIGTMNDIDRSVESMDFALRRRFSLHEAVVNPEMLLPAFTAMGFGRNAEQLSRLVTALNQAIEDNGRRFGLNRQYFISHGQFTNLPASIRKDGPLHEILEHVWAYRLESLLREYLRGVNEEDIDAFVGKCKAAFMQKGKANDRIEG